MIFPEVKKLYKYMSYNTNTISCLVHGEFWCAKPQTFNDPLDCGIQLLSDLNKEALLVVLQNYLRFAEERADAEAVRLFREFIESTELNDEMPNEVASNLAELKRKHFSQEIQEIGILSLSEVCDNILMWSHYAEQHKGLCVEFERKSGNFLALNEHTLPVRYSTKKPIISVNEEVLGDVDQKKEIRRSLIYTKSSDWAYEREWRLVTALGNKSITMDANIISVIFGYKMPSEHKKTIINVLKNKKDIKFKEATLKSDEFGIDIIEVDPSKYLTLADLPRARRSSNKSNTPSSTKVEPGINRKKVTLKSSPSKKTIDKPD